MPKRRHSNIFGKETHSKHNHDYLTSTSRTPTAVFSLYSPSSVLHYRTMWEYFMRPLWNIAAFPVHILTAISDAFAAHDDGDNSTPRIPEASTYSTKPTDALTNPAWPSYPETAEEYQMFIDAVVEEVSYTASLGAYDATKQNSMEAIMLAVIHVIEYSIEEGTRKYDVCQFPESFRYALLKAAMATAMLAVKNGVSASGTAPPIITAPPTIGPVEEARLFDVLFDIRNEAASTLGKVTGTEALMAGGPLTIGYLPRSKLSEIFRTIAREAAIETHMDLVDDLPSQVRSIRLALESIEAGIQAGIDLKTPLSNTSAAYRCAMTAAMLVAGHGVHAWSQIGRHLIDEPSERGCLARQQYWEQMAEAEDEAVEAGAVASIAAYHGIYPSPSPSPGLSMPMLPGRRLGEGR
ncbi:hypothetical protein F4778DRAFT_797549 [Xylariomycetidae sp. FL2044]|nr:hypothetical protein F4778DRAFT_797549 [Xylariomycetidae sp. FL2044]